MSFLKEIERKTREKSKIRKMFDAGQRSTSVQVRITPKMSEWLSSRPKGKSKYIRNLIMEDIRTNTYEKEEK